MHEREENYEFLLICSEECYSCTDIFCKILRIWASTENFLKLSDLEYSEFSYEFIEGNRIHVYDLCSCEHFKTMLF